MLTMLVLLIVGVAASKTGVVDAETNKRLTRFAMAVPQCAIILSSAMNLEMEMTVGKVLGILGAGAVMYALLIALAFLAPRIAGVKGSDRGVFTFLGAFGNVAYMGYPLVGALFGSDAVFYATILCIPFNLLAFTVGVDMLAGGGRRGKMSWRDFVNPAMVSSVLAVIITFLPVKWPGPLTEAVSILGDMILPLSMIIIGATLGEQKLSQVFLDWRVYLFAPVKLLLAPALLWAVMGLFIKDKLLLDTITVLGGMPCAAVAAMLSIQYGADERLASRAVVLTTVLSVGTIPLVCWLLLR